MKHVKFFVLVAVVQVLAASAFAKNSEYVCEATAIDKEKPYYFNASVTVTTEKQEKGALETAAQGEVNLQIFKTSTNQMSVNVENQSWLGTLTNFETEDGRTKYLALTNSADTMTLQLSKIAKGRYAGYLFTKKGLIQSTCKKVD